MVVETRRRTQDGNGDGSGDGNKSSSGDRDVDVDGNEDVIGNDSTGVREKRKGVPVRWACHKSLGAAALLQKVLDELHTRCIHNNSTLEDQCEWHRLTGMTEPDCAVMCNLINTHTHKYTHKIETEAGTGREPEWWWRPVDEHKMGTGTGAGTETRAVAEIGTWTWTETRM